MAYAYVEYDIEIEFVSCTHIFDCKFRTRKEKINNNNDTIEVFKWTECVIDGLCYGKSYVIYNIDWKEIGHQ